jgi:hypothetical protein
MWQRLSRSKTSILSLGCSHSLRPWCAFSSHVFRPELTLPLVALALVLAKAIPICASSSIAILVILNTRTAVRVMPLSPVLKVFFQDGERTVPSRSDYC